MTEAYSADTTRRPLALSGASLASAALIVASALPAYAGKTSAMTLEVQHGCLPNEVGIDKVAAYFGTKFGKVGPQPLAGWTSKVRPTSDGRKIKVLAAK